MSLWSDRIVNSGILFLILATPFAFGSVHPWAYSAMEAIVFALVIVWMLKLAMLARTQGAGSREQRAERLSPLAFPLALFILLTLFQLMPLPPSWLRVISPATFAAYTQIVPGWPESVPYGEQEAMSREQRAGSAEQGAEPAISDQKPGVRGQKSESGQSAIRNPQFEIAPSGSSPSPSASPLALRSALLAPSSLLPAEWFPLSLAPALTRTDLLKLLAYAALFFLIWRYPVGDTWQLTAGRFVHTGLRQLEEKFARSLLFMILVTGLLVAAIGFVERFSWNGKILWSFVPFDWGEPMANGVPRASGPFINPDHYGNYLALIFPIALIGVLFRVAVVRKSLEHSARIFSGVTVLLILTGILLSLSRGAWISSLFGILVVLGFMPWQLGRLPAFITRRGFTMVRAALMVLCVILIVSLFFIGPEGRDQVDARLGETMVQDAGIGGRTAIWRDSPALVKDFPFFGVGLGAWPELFLHYRGGPWSGDFFREAHNDYLQLSAEAGIVGFGLLAGFFFLGGKRLVQGLRTASSKNRAVMAAIIAALAVMALHECFDFNLQIPANAFLFTLLFALGLRLVSSGEQGAGRNELRAKGQGLGEGAESEWAISDFQFENPEADVTGQASEASHPLSPIRHLQSATRNFLAPLAPYAVSIVAVVLIIFAVNQEQLPYPYNLREPNSLAEAKALLLSHPTHAPYHLALLRLAGNDALLSWQISESKAALWIEPTNPYLRDLYGATLIGIGETDRGLQEVTLSVANSPALSNHVYLADDSLSALSAAEQLAVEDGFKRGLARGYPEAMENLAGFYAKLTRFSDQAAVYEQAALKESDIGKRADLLIAGGLAYLKDADAQGAKGKAQSASSSPLALSALPLAAPGTTPHAAAERLFRAAIAINPTDPKGYQQLTTAIYGARKDFAGARDIIALGIKNGAPALSLYLSLTEAAQQGGSADEAKAALQAAGAEVEKAAQNGAASHAIYLQLADGARKVGDREQETAALLKALELQPHSADTLFRLASLSIEQRKFDRAALYMNRVTTITPDSANSYFQLAVAEEGRYHFPDAGKAYARAVELAPENDNYRQRYAEFRARVDRNRVTGDGGRRTGDRGPGDPATRGQIVSER